ncbi:MAG: rRNA biogenesis protein rrp5 [Eubacteriales bacterium]|nr:rRNA biogenesis protein rrp5 [Eubacteriales bacterium]
MSRIKLLKDVADDMSALAESIASLAKAITSDQEETAEPAPQLTLSDVRGVLARKSQAGLTKGIKALIKKYGAERLSDVKPEDYEALLKDVEGLS